MFQRVVFIIARGPRFSCGGRAFAPFGAGRRLVHGGRTNSVNRGRAGIPVDATGSAPGAFRLGGMKGGAIGGVSVSLVREEAGAIVGGWNRGVTEGWVTEEKDVLGGGTNGVALGAWYGVTDMARTPRTI